MSCSRACETGLSEITSNPDEFIGLPGTFTALGAAGVLGTLWPVSDAATALLIAKFYELHIEQRLSPPTALHQAQALAARGQRRRDRRLCQGRGGTGPHGEPPPGGDRAGAEHGCDRPAQDRATAQDGARAPATTGAVKRAKARYAHPYYWAGFIHTGL